MIALRWPSWRAWCLLGLGLAVTIAAGAWQYGKAQYKREREARWADARQSLEIPLARALERNALGFDRVRATGIFALQRYVLDNQIRDGQAGVDVFVPLRSSEGADLLIALGWLPYADASRQLPEVPVLPSEAVELVGLLTPPPSHGLRFGRDWADTQSSYPKLMPYFSLDDISSDSGKVLAPRILRLDADPESPYRRNWRPVDAMPPARHLAYAWQWWFLSIAIAVVFIIVHRRRERTQ